VGCFSRLTESITPFFTKKIADVLIKILIVQTYT